VAETPSDATIGTLADQLRALGVRGVLVQMAERGQLLELRCEMPNCYYFKGRKSFAPRGLPLSPWAPNTDHYPILRSAGGKLVPENVRLAHVRCNNYDYGWRTRIKTLLSRGRSLEEIAEELARRRVPPPHGRQGWTAKWVRQAYVS
jgi:hypothetical protein